MRRTFAALAGPPRWRSPCGCSTKLVAEVFGLAAEIVADPLTGTPLVLPVPTRRKDVP